MARPVFRILSASFMALLLIVGIIGTGWIGDTAKAANFGMRTGYYVGNGTATAVSGLGFQPNFVIIKSTTALVGMIKTSSMSGATTSYFGATADLTTQGVTLTADGFSLGTSATVNGANVLYRWTAFYGSDCSATGNFCVGTYTGNASNPRAITVGFQPNAVIVKRSTAVAAHFRTSSMAANRTEFFTSTAANTAGDYIQSMAATSFTVGTTDNASGGVYYYVAFKSTAGSFAVGTYTGTGADNRNITGVGFQPSMVMVKNSTSATTNNRRSAMNQTMHHGDMSSYFSDTVADAANMIQGLIADGFQVGSSVNTNQSGATLYYMAFGGEVKSLSGTGTFTMAQGTYTGTGAVQSVTSLSFKPDLVLIKDNAANFAVFRIREMAGNITAYLGTNVTDFANGITSLNVDGFSLGTSTITNTTGNTYHWQAFGGAYDPTTNTGAADFATGIYYGNGIDSRNIDYVMPFQADFITGKRNNTTAGAFRTSVHSGDLSDIFTGTASAANYFQTLRPTGFQVGTAANVNTSGSMYRWFAFKTGPNFSVGSYTGNGVNARPQVTAFGPDLLWVKSASTGVAVQRPGTLAGDATQFFSNTANAADNVETMTQSGLTLGTSANVNTNAIVYRYAAWRQAPNGVFEADVVDAGGSSVGSPFVSLATAPFVFTCSPITGTLGVASQKVRVKNNTVNSNWTLSLAPTAGPTALWSTAGNTYQYDFNDTSGSTSGCGDGGDGDTFAGKLLVSPSVSTLTPQVGCSNTGISTGTDQNYSQGVTDSILLLTASSTTNTECYWDLTDVSLEQMIPLEQTVGSYSLDMTLTAVAY